MKLNGKGTYVHKILPITFENQFATFLDIIGFSNIVSQNNLEQLDRYFYYVNKILTKLKETNSKIDFLFISDSIIIVSPNGATGLKQIIKIIKQILAYADVQKLKLPNITKEVDGNHTD